MRDVRERSRGEVNRGLDDGLSKAFELALTPAICGVLGWLLDQRLEVTPLFTLIAFFLGVIGTSISLWSRYDATMRVQEAEAAEARAARGPRRRLTEVLPVDVARADVAPGDAEAGGRAGTLEPST